MYSRNINFNSIGDLLDYRKYLKSEIERVIDYIDIPSVSIYYLWLRYTLGLVDLQIKRKGYNV